MPRTVGYPGPGIARRGRPAPRIRVGAHHPCKIKILSQNLIPMRLAARRPRKQQALIPRGSRSLIPRDGNGLFAASRLWSALLRNIGSFDY